MKAIYIVVTLWTLVVVFGALYFAKVKELRQDLGRAVNNTQEAKELTLKYYRDAQMYRDQRDSLQKIVNLKTEKP